MAQRFPNPLDRVAGLNCNGARVEPMLSVGAHVNCVRSGQGARGCDHREQGQDRPEPGWIARDGDFCFGTGIESAGVWVHLYFRFHCFFSIALLFLRRTAWCPLFVTTLCPESL